MALGINHKALYYSYRGLKHHTVQCLWTGQGNFFSGNNVLKRLIFIYLINLHHEHHLHVNHNCMWIVNK